MRIEGRPTCGIRSHNSQYDERERFILPEVSQQRIPAEASGIHREKKDNIQTSQVEPVSSHPSPSSVLSPATPQPRPSSAPAAGVGEEASDMAGSWAASSCAHFANSQRYLPTPDANEHTVPSFASKRVLTEHRVSCQPRRMGGSPHLEVVVHFPNPVGDLALKEHLSSENSTSSPLSGLRCHLKRRRW